MAWLLIISSVIVIWIASLFKILHGSYSPSKGAFLNDSTNGGSAKKRNVLLVVSHPDDESMFFTPTINYLTSRGRYIHILCLSNCRCEIELKISSEGVQLSYPKTGRVQ